MMLGSHGVRAVQVPPHRQPHGRRSGSRLPQLCVRMSQVSLIRIWLSFLKCPDSYELLLTIAGLVGCGRFDGKHLANRATGAVNVKAKWLLNASARSAWHLQPKRQSQSASD